MKSKSKNNKKNEEKSSRKGLSPQQLISISSVFNDNGWKIKKELNPEDSLFNRFCERMLEVKDEEGQALFLDLAKRYLWLSSDFYFMNLLKALEHLVSEYEKLTSDTKVYVMMLIAPKDEGKTKSSAMLLYLFNDTRLRIDPRFSHYRFEIISDKESLHQKMDDKDAVLVLVDDYIGTGDTAVACVEQLDKLGIKMEQIAILSLVAQEEGKKKIEEKGIFFCTSNLRNKGISDYYEGKELEKNVRLMQKIEKDLKVGEKSRFGYGQSEALVTMCRTPNNTFPVFWYEPELGIKKKLAPFPRF
ncbi:phosphoribosyltransferase [Blautia obeum]|jgi:hypothetical protein|uniref:phosphoribosyltransferase n=1 Tax=Blautia obeum TaxID=40520 RepID=UPI00356A2080